MRLEELRAATLENNLLWLTSFGCTVRRLAGLVLVEHEDLPEYDARLLLDAADQTLARLGLLLSEEARRPHDLYVDHHAEDPAMRELLAGVGYAPRSTSLTMAGIWSGGEPPPADVALRRVSRDELDAWSDLYSRAFGRSAGQAAVDRRRWRRAAAERSLISWLFLRGGERIGTVQTCAAHGVVGIYSFAILPPHRRLMTTLHVLRALRAEVTGGGEAIVYFERAREESPGCKVSPVEPQAHRFAAVRRWTRYAPEHAALAGQHS